MGLGPQLNVYLHFNVSGLAMPITNLILGRLHMKELFGQPLPHSLSKLSAHNSTYQKPSE